MGSRRVARLKCLSSHLGASAHTASCPSPDSKGHAGKSGLGLPATMEVCVRLGG